jgi:NeuB family
MFYQTLLYHLANGGGLQGHYCLSTQSATIKHFTVHFSARPQVSAAGSSAVCPLGATSGRPGALAPSSASRARPAVAEREAGAKRRRRGQKKGRFEFGYAKYREIDQYCRERHIAWFASCWDEPSVDFLEQFTPVCYKIASASLTDDSLLQYINATGRPMILSTGMSTMAEIRHAVSLLDRQRLLLAHCTSSYPCPPAELNLRMIHTLQQEFALPVGYSGHEVGLQTTCAAVALGACFPDIIETNDVVILTRPLAWPISTPAHISAIMGPPKLTTPRG